MTDYKTYSTTSWPKSVEDSRTVLHGLFRTHTYRDGILSSRGVYILFPGIATRSNA